MKSRVITLGEIMLRLNSPGFERLLQSNIFEATFGGAEANVAVSLANYKIDVAFVTVLPSNAIADACIVFLQSRNIDTSLIVRSGERIGAYYVESGSNQRPSLVIYDRSNSSIANIKYEGFDWDKVFKGVNWLHITGITPAISQSAADLSLFALQTAKEKGITISCDYNYRGKLWKYGKNAIEIMTEIVKFVDVGIANEEDCQLALGITIPDENWESDIKRGSLNLEKYRVICEKVLEKYPNLKMQAITLRQSYNANHNGWSGCLHDRKQFIVGPHYDITHIVDRIGVGDAFSGGLIYGLISEMSHKDALSFAVASSCLKHSIPGDANRVSVDDVMQLLAGDVSGRVKR